MTTDRGQTALIVAVHQGYTRIVEKLVGYGADLNVSDADGDTALHLALVRETIASITVDTPEMDKVRLFLYTLMSTYGIDLQFCV